VVGKEGVEPRAARHILGVVGFSQVSRHTSVLWATDRAVSLHLRTRRSRAISSGWVAAGSGSLVVDEMMESGMFRSIDMRWRRIGAVGIVAFGLITAVCISLLANGGAVHGGAASKPWSSPATRGQVNLARTVNVSQLPTMGHAAPSITIPLHGAMLAVGPNSAYARNAPHQAGFPYSPTDARPPQKSPDVVGTSQIPLLYKNLPGMTAADGGCSACAPPDPAIGVSNGYVVEGVNSAFSIYNTSLTKLAGPYSAVSLLGLQQAGDAFSDPQITYDAERAVWVQAWIEYSFNSGTGVWYDWIDLAVSTGGSPYPTTSPTLNYHVYKAGSPTGEFCDFPTVGYDYWDVWVTCTEYDSSLTFTGNSTYAFDLNTMIAGSSPLIYYSWPTIPSSQGCSPSCVPAYSISPAIEDGVPNAEWVTASDQCAGAVCSGHASNNLTACAYTNTHYASTGLSPTQSCLFNNVLLGYADPIIYADQAGHPASMYAGVGYKQIRYTGGHLYFAMTEDISCAGTFEDGIIWYEVTPRLNAYVSPNPQTIAGVVQEQAGTWCFGGHIDSYMPTAVPSYEGDIALVYNYSSSVSGYYPTIGYTGRQEADAVGTMGQGVDNGYVAGNMHANTSTHWGVYSTCALIINSVTRGIAYCVGEFVGADLWDTQLYALRMQ
jgi:hypothetical protein